MISHACIKFYGIEKQFEAKLGESQQLVHDWHMDIWKVQNNGKSFRYWACAEYFRNKQKWRSVLLSKDADKKKKGASDEDVKIKRPSRKKKAMKDKEHRDLVELIAKSAIDEHVEEKLVIAKKAKQEKDAAAGNVFAEQHHQFLAEASAGLKIFFQDAAMEKLMAKAATHDKAEWRKKQVANAIAEMEKCLMQSMLAMEENELHSKLVIAELKLKLKLVKEQ